jgi:hypothetical protein
MKLSRRVAGFNRLVTNRIQGLYAWFLPPWAVILHRGRRSGRQYRTPMLAFRRDQTLVIALVYGQESIGFAICGPGAAKGSVRGVSSQLGRSR